MKVDRADLYEYRLPMARPFVISSGPMTEGRGLILALHADGLTGWGECPTGLGPIYSYETTVTAWHIAQDYLVPALAWGDARMRLTGSARRPVGEKGNVFLLMPRGTPYVGRKGWMRYPREEDWLAEVKKNRKPGDTRVIE